MNPPSDSSLVIRQQVSPQEGQIHFINLQPNKTYCVTFFSNFIDQSGTIFVDQVSVTSAASLIMPPPVLLSTATQENIIYIILYVQYDVQDWSNLSMRVTMLDLTMGGPPTVFDATTPNNLVPTSQLLNVSVSLSQVILFVENLNFNTLYGFHLQMVSQGGIGPSGMLITQATDQTQQPPLPPLIQVWCSD